MSDYLVIRTLSKSGNAYTLSEHETIADAAAERERLLIAGLKAFIAKRVYTTVVEAVDADGGVRRTTGAELRRAIEELLPSMPAEFHYRDLQRELEEHGTTVGGKDPGATLLTNLARCDRVMSVAPRSGRYRYQPEGTDA